MARTDLTVDEHRYKLTVISKSETRTDMGMGVVVTVNMLVGLGDHLSLAGTLSMTESEWKPLAEALRASLGDRIEFEEIDRRH